MLVVIRCPRLPRVVAVHSVNRLLMVTTVRHHLMKATNPLIRVTLKRGGLHQGKGNRARSNVADAVANYTITPPLVFTVVFIPMLMEVCMPF